MARYAIADFSEVVPRECPCGRARRAFVDEPEGTATMHMVEISIDSKVHSIRT